MATPHAAKGEAKLTTATWRRSKKQTREKETKNMHKEWNRWNRKNTMKQLGRNAITPTSAVAGGWILVGNENMEHGHNPRKTWKGIEQDDAALAAAKVLYEKYKEITGTGESNVRGRTSWQTAQKKTTQLALHEWSSVVQHMKVWMKESSIYTVFQSSNGMAHNLAGSPTAVANDLSLFPQSLIRNFSVIAHIDHGKSTLSDRLLELTGAIKSGSRKQYLDRLPVERSRGITVKAQTASMFFPWQSTTYLLNLIDTPGHVDFSYEVSRSLAACQGALLLVDAAQGIQAQTVSTFYAAFEADLSIIPVINKIDMPAADPERVTEEICMAFDFDPEDVLAVSAKTGEGLERVLPAIVERVPPPHGHPEAPLRLLLFDSYYDEYRGVVCLVQVVDGVLQKGDKIVSLNADDRYEALEVGIFTPEPVKSTNLYTGQVGYVIMGMKTVTAARVGDTYAHEKSDVEPLPGFKPSKPMVFAGLFPINPEDFEMLQASIEKLTVNDPSVMVRRDNSAALGAGYRCGFLGLLHMDVFHQRLQEEYGASVIASPPSVPYNIKLMDGDLMHIDSPSDFPIGKRILRVEEPMVIATIVLPSEFLGSIMELCQQCRGEQIDQIAVDDSRTLLRYKMPLAEIATTFYDSLKSRSSGYASFDYEEIGMQPADVIRMDLLVNGDPVDALARIVPRERAEKEGKTLVTKMKELLPRQMFDISIQASVGRKVVARATIKAYRKDVTAKLYGGDVTRKRKLLEKQKAGKKKMKRIGRVEIPQEAFYEILSR